MTIRVRQHDNVAQCVGLLAAVHALDSYPLHWPADPFAWLSPPNLLIAWVAEVNGVLSGHVALCAAEDDVATSAWSLASGKPPERLAVVAKLFVSPGARGLGLGAALLDTASAEARRWRLLPVLEVLDHDRSAIALYERTGWLRVASVSVLWAQVSEGRAEVHYYVAPRARRSIGSGA